MTVDVYCDSCLTEDEDGGEIEVSMEVYGSLFFNPDTKSQAQGYKCPKCEHVVTIVIVTP